jgi:hypothetical protein
MHPPDVLARTPAALAVALLCLAARPAPAAGQEPAPDSLAAQLARLRARVDSLEALVRGLQSAGREAEAGDALEELRAAARAAAAARPAAPTDTTPQAFEGRQRSLQALNPEISLNADVLAHVDRDDTDADTFVPREFEISLQASLDPYSRAKVFLSHHSAGAELAPFAAEEDAHEEGGGLAVEEGYVQWVSLPGGLGLKLGKFNQRFGALNRWHAHALPFQTRSLPHLAFIGEESLAQTGASLDWLVPLHGAGTWEATLEVARSENEALFGESDRASVLGHVNAFWQLSRSSDLDLGLSWINGSFETEEHLFDQNLYGVEVAYTWRPPERARYRGLMVRGGLMVKDPAGGVLPHEEEEAGEEEEDVEPILDRSALGVWSLAELRLSPSWLVGGRVDWVEDPTNPDRTAWLVSPTVTWWQSEWVRVRAEYDLLGRSVGEDTGKFLLQVTFAMGPHKHETY